MLVLLDLHEVPGDMLGHSYVCEAICVLEGIQVAAKFLPDYGDGLDDVLVLAGLEYQYLAGGVQSWAVDVEFGDHAECALAAYE